MTKMYVISWFGGERPDRRAYHHGLQLEWAKQQGFDVHVVAQEYQEQQKQPGVVYLGDNSRMTPGAARNIAKAHFYQTNDDWAVFADDDAWVNNINPNQDWRVLLTQDVPSVDLFLPPSHMVPYVKMYNDLGRDGQENFCFQRVARLKGSFYVMRNLRKHYGQELYHANPDLLPGEDVHFGFDLIKAGFGMYTLMNIKLMEKYTASTWTTKEGRKQRDDANMRLITQEFGVKTKETPKGLRVVSFGSLWQNSTRPKKVQVPIYQSELWA